MRAKASLTCAASAVALLAMTGRASPDDLHRRSNWVPNVGLLDFGGDDFNSGRAEQPLGDMWTFRCPSGGTVSASVDTKDDTDEFTADIGPVLLVIDGSGHLLVLLTTRWTARMNRFAASPARRW